MMQEIIERANKYFDNEYEKGLSSYELIADESTLEEHDYCYSVFWCLKNESHLSVEKRTPFGGGGRLLISKISNDIEMEGSNPDRDWIKEFEAEIRGFETFWCLEIPYSKNTIGPLKTILNCTTSEVLNHVNQETKIVFEDEYHKLIEMQKSFDDLKIETKLNFLEKEKELKYQIFGSSTSIDLDVCFFVDSVHSIDENHKRVAELIQKVNFNTDKKVNANLAVVSDGIIVDCFKGILDELNNSLFLTYNLHPQKYECQIKRLLDRNIEAKIERCARTITSYFARTKLRVEAKKALKSDVKAKIQFLATIKLSEFDDFGKHGSVIEVYKSIAFQLGQTLALMDGKEVFTKKDIASIYPSLEKYLNRKEESSSYLQTVLQRFIEKAKAY